MSETVRILTEARELLSVPERWTQGVSARQADGLFTSPLGARAVCWCPWAACYRASGKRDNDAARFLRAAIGSFAIPKWSDAPERTHAEILAAFDKAIDLAKAEVAA